MLVKAALRLKADPIPTLSLITSMLRSQKNCMSDAFQCCVTDPMKFSVSDSSHCDFVPYFHKWGGVP